MTDRGAVVIVENDKVALIRREKAGRVYYVFPGGKQEIGETIEQCAKREAFEELGVEVEIGELLTTVPYNGIQHYFCAKITGGQFGTGQAEEFMEADNGTYLPVWIKASDLYGKNVIPAIVVQVLNMKKEG
ncbi:NUDIX domain-containing protein [Solibacillus sp. MA9]|uniref:NUDIX domain-containing protein n=1 Tax=Solibacillus palustris TaxID=2908203 RepID=A0ABS9UHG0_9BACL|nr:NUDIX domain-containing protein [Solibacillus sp. MA9]MCH7323742.1 NUDIX domain-containing protein [Solibacillus sp. MA9]